MERDPVPTVQETSWAPGPFWTGVENLTLTGIWSLDSPPCRKSLYWVLHLRKKNLFPHHATMETWNVTGEI